MPYESGVFFYFGPIKHLALVIFPDSLYTNSTLNLNSMGINTALRARLKQAQKNTRIGKRVARTTKKLRRNNYLQKPRILK